MLVLVASVVSLPLPPQRHPDANRG